jgi:hypothetical protein
MAGRSPLEVGKELQLVIAAADDFGQILQPLRAKRAKRSTTVAAGLGAATSVVVGGSLIAANLGFWASVGTALGLATLPILATVIGGGLAVAGMRKAGVGGEEKLRLDQILLTLGCFQTMAEADGHISDEERIILRSVLLQFPLSAAESRVIADTPVEATLEAARSLSSDLRRQVLQGTWMLAEADGVSPAEEQTFVQLCETLGLADEITQLKKYSHDLQAEGNELISAMFRICQQVLSPSLGKAEVNQFLESLATIAATPATRRSLRNSINRGFSAGGVARSIDEHAQAPKLIAQAQNAIRATCGEGDETKAAQRRLLDLAENTRMGRAEGMRIIADLDALFDEQSA